MSDENAVFGYGSLILPMSTISRFDKELGEEVDEISDNSDNRLKDLLEFYLKDKQIEKYRNSKLKFLPAKIYGFRRYYALEMEEEGNQLTAVESNEDEFINGVLIFPLTDREFEGICGTEEGYKRQEINRDNIEFYKEPEKIHEIPEKILFFTGTDHRLINMSTEKTRDPNYHSFISKGVKIISKELFNEEERQKEFQKDFMEDFKKHTYEKKDGNWARLSKL